MLLGNLKPLPPGKFLNRLRKAQTQMLDKKANRGAMCPASKAVIELLCGADRKRRRLFVVKRAQATEVAARFFQADMLPYEVDDIDTPKQVIDE